MTARRLALHIGLFLATLLTTTAAGALSIHHQILAPGPGWARLALLPDGLSYSVPLMLILLCHELGHYFVARAHGVEASLPYFIPLPPQLGLGTMGAIIGMRASTRDRVKLIDVGAAGPLCGLAVAIPVILYGLSLSPVVPMHAGTMQEGNSLLYAGLKWLSKGAWLPDGRHDVFLHPTAWAGWAGLFVTMLNLLPIAQLDGGHIATAYFGNAYNRFAVRLHRVLPAIAVGIFIWVFFVAKAEAGERWDKVLGVWISGGAALPWVVWWLLIGILRRAGGGLNHPPVDDAPLPRSRRLLFGLMVVVFFAVLMPVPFRMTLAGP